jgi:RNA polymerase sigma-70 factor (ECF subfamily)
MDATAIFERHRRLLEGLAYRMLGSLAEAQDVVQDTYLKWRSADLADIREPRAWLVTVCSRLSLNALGTAQKRRETYVGTWLPEPLFSADLSAPERLELDESVSLAWLVALERLSPDERAAFVLHEVFGHSFEELASMLGKSCAACRKLASRARARVRASRPRFDADVEQHSRLVGEFFGALHAGDSTALERQLCASVELLTDGGGKVEAATRIIHGRAAVTQYFLGVWKHQAARGIVMTSTPYQLNGAPGALVLENGRVTTALGLGVADGEIVAIYAQRNPDKLGHLASVR